MEASVGLLSRNSYGASGARNDSAAFLSYDGARHVFGQNLVEPFLLRDHMGHRVDSLSSYSSLKLTLSDPRLSAAEIADLGAWGGTVVFV